MKYPMRRVGQINNREEERMLCIKNYPNIRKVI